MNATIPIIVLVFTTIFGHVGWYMCDRSDTEATEALAPPIAITRELHCEEDEDIVTTLGANGIPYAFCEQVIER